MLRRTDDSQRIKQIKAQVAWERRQYEEHLALLLQIDHEDCDKVIDDEGHTVSHVAACRNYANVISGLHDMDGGISKKHDNYGNTPLLWAIANSSIEAALKLIELSPDTINTANTDPNLGNTPLSLAISKGSTHCDDDRVFSRPQKSQSEVIQALLNANAEVNCQDSCGNTPLHYAVLHRDLPLIQQLIAKGAQINCQNHAGITPIGMLAYNKFGSSAMLKSRARVFTFDKTVFTKPVRQNIIHEFSQHGLSLSEIQIDRLRQSRHLMDQVKSLHTIHLYDHILDLNKINGNTSSHKIGIFNKLMRTICDEVAKYAVQETMTPEALQANIQTAYNKVSDEHAECLSEYSGKLEKFLSGLLNALIMFFSLGMANYYHYQKTQHVFFKPFKSETFKQVEQFRNDIPTITI